jgi:hypothetical protein
MSISAYRDGLRASVLRHGADAYVGYLKHHSIARRRFAPTFTASSNFDQSPSMPPL